MYKPPSDMSEWQRLKTRSTRKIAFVHLPRLQQAQGRPQTAKLPQVSRF